MEEPLNELNGLQIQLFYMGIPDLGIIEIPNQIIYGMFCPYIVFLDQYYFYSRNDNNEIQEIVVLVIRGL